MSVRKRTWKTAKGETKEAWVVSYSSPDKDGKLKGHIETFGTKKAADARHAEVRVNISKGTHTPLNNSGTIAMAARDWLAFVELEGRERSTIANYTQHIDQHIIPRIGAEKLAKLTTPRINAFRDDLLRTCSSRTLAHKIFVSFKSILKDARRRGNLAQNVADGVTIKANKRAQGRLEVGVHIPTPQEISRFLGAATGRWRPFLIAAVFTGLRSSELRGLRWVDVDFDKGEVHVRQRADRYNGIGAPKTKSSVRTVPVGPFVVNTLKEWKLRCPHELVFATRSGKVASRANLVMHALWPTMLRAGITDATGKPKYKGLHTLRHFYASWCINRRADGGLELPPKMVQERLGHSSIVMTMDVYGHLFPRVDDGKELEQAELRLLG
jgi:integrase